VPARIGEAQGGIACIGPDEWFADLPAGTSLPLGAGEPVSVVDVSSRGVAFEVEGEKAAWVISAGCALDIANFAVGRVTRTMFETAEIILWRTGETSFRVFAWRSFGPGCGTRSRRWKPDHRAHTGLIETEKGAWPDGLTPLFRARKEGGTGRNLQDKGRLTPPGGHAAPLSGGRPYAELSRPGVSSSGRSAGVGQPLEGSRPWPATPTFRRFRLMR
jgi:heterotetrameric sarcosine oxidase gamma subunit